MQFKQVDAIKYAMHLRAGERKDVRDDVPNGDNTPATDAKQLPTFTSERTPGAPVVGLIIIGGLQRQ